MRVFSLLALSLLACLVPVAFWLGIDFSRFSQPGPMTLAGLAILLLFLLFAALVLELYFQLVRIPGAMLLRIEHFWNFASPAISIFLLTAEPLISWSGMLGSGPIFPALAGHLWLALALLLLLLALFFFPLFRGMNATFLLAGVAGARFILLPASIGPESSIQEYGPFSLYSLALSLLIFLFLQSRRRLALSPEYETFPVPYGLSYFAFFLIPLMLALHFGANQWNPDFPGQVPGLICVFLAVYWWLSGLLLSKDAKASSPGSALGWFQVIYFVVQIALLSFLMRSESLGPAAYRSKAVAEGLTFFAAFLDRDRDGNSWFPGGDPDDSNPGIRADFISSTRTASTDGRTTDPFTVRERSGKEALDVSSEDAGRTANSLEGPGRTNDSTEEPRRFVPPESNPGTASGERLLTVALPFESLSAGLPDIESVSVLTSDDLAFSLRDLLHGRDPVEGKDSRSILSDYVDRGYRTICTGNGGYFNHVHPARLDEGCQVLEPYSLNLEDAGRKKDHARIVEGVKEYLYRSNVLFRKYREDRFFFWVHLDLTKTALSWSEIQPVLEIWKNDFEGKRNTVVLVQGPASLVFLDTNLFSVAKNRSRIGFYRKDLPAPWARGIHELLGPDFVYPMQSFGLDPDSGELWIGNQMTGSRERIALPLSPAGEKGSPRDEQRRIKNLQP